MIKLSREDRKMNREIAKAHALVAETIGTQVLDCAMDNPGYLPKVAEKKIAVALAVLGVASWNPATASRW